MILIQAAVCRDKDEPFDIESVELDDPRDDEVLIRVVGAGICHTDMIMRDQLAPTPQPVVLGHEGSGIVERVGDSVTHVKLGDRVVMSFLSCGVCPNCESNSPAYCYEHLGLNMTGRRPDGTTSMRDSTGAIHGNIYGQSSFATYAVSGARNTVRVPDSAADIPIELLGPLGCGIQTGAGAILNSLNVGAGESVVVTGTGAVGLSSILAARMAGAGVVIAVDLNEERLELALELGATHTINGRSDLGAEIAKVCPRGVNYGVDTTGNVAVCETIFGALASGGTLGCVGAPSSSDATLSLNARSLLGGGKTVRGILEGDSDPHVFIPKLIEHYQAGDFPFDRLVRFFDFEDINEAFRAGESGEVVKPVVRMPASSSLLSEPDA